jgi:hypothetical protein
MEDTWPTCPCIFQAPEAKLKIYIFMPFFHFYIFPIYFIYLFCLCVFFPFYLPKILYSLKKLDLHVHDKFFFKNKEFFSKETMD